MPKVPAVERDQGRARHVPESCCMYVVYLVTTVSIFVEGTSTDEWMVDPRQEGLGGRQYIIEVSLMGRHV